MNFRGLKVVNKHCSSRLLSYPVQRWNLSWVGEKRQLWNYNLCDPVDYSSPGSSVHGILQARILECVALASSRGSSQPRDQTHISYVSSIGRRVFCLPLMPPGKPIETCNSLCIFFLRTKQKETLCLPAEKKLYKGKVDPPYRNPDDRPHLDQLH